MSTSEKEISGLLKLDFFKGQGFPTKESGIKFIMSESILKKKIRVKANELEECKYNIIEDIKNLFEKFEGPKDLFMKTIKADRAAKAEEKKQKAKEQLKSEMKDEIMKEIKDEEYSRRIMKLKIKYPEYIPEISLDAVHNLDILEQLFMKAVENGEDLKTVAKMKTDTEKALATLAKVRKVMGVLGA
jgi:hypothetical protein